MSYLNFDNFPLVVQDMLENESRKCTEKALLHFGTSKIKPPIPPLQTHTNLVHFNTLRCAIQSFNPLILCGNCIAGVNLKHIRRNQAENTEQPHREGSGGTGHNFITWFVASEYGPNLRGTKVRHSLSLCSLLSIQIPVYAENNLMNIDSNSKYCGNHLKVPRTSILFWLIFKIFKVQKNIFFRKIKRLVFWRKTILKWTYCIN